jgi:hypothetical protein
MARIKGSKNKNSAEVPMYTSLPTEEKLFVLANLIIDRIIEDQQTGGKLFRQLVEQGDAKLRST